MASTRQGAGHLDTSGYKSLPAGRPPSPIITDHFFNQNSLNEKRNQSSLHRMGLVVPRKFYRASSVFSLPCESP